MRPALLIISNPSRQQTPDQVQLEQYSGDDQQPDHFSVFARMWVICATANKMIAVVMHQ